VRKQPDSRKTTVFAPDAGAGKLEAGLHRIKAVTHFAPNFRFSAETNKIRRSFLLASTAAGREVAWGKA
jgi:hypothetical protein